MQKMSCFLVALTPLGWDGPQDKSELENQSRFLQELEQGASFTGGRGFSYQHVCSSSSFFFFLHIRFALLLTYCPFCGGVRRGLSMEADDDFFSYSLSLPLSLSLVLFLSTTARALFFLFFSFFFVHTTCAVALLLAGREALKCCLSSLRKHNEKA